MVLGCTGERHPEVAVIVNELSPVSEAIGQAYADYRNRLFAPIHEASQLLDDQLGTLEDNLDDEDSDAVYARMRTHEAACGDAPGAAPTRGWVARTSVPTQYVPRLAW